MTFLPTLKASQLKEIVTGCFIIDKYANKLEAKKHLLNYFIADGSEKQLDEFLLLIYNKWDDFFTSLINDKEFYSNDLVLTDYCEFVVEYFVSAFNDDEIILLLLEEIEKIINIDSLWVKNASFQTTHFYMSISKIYLLSYVYKTKKINDLQISMKFDLIKDDNVKRNRYYKKNDFDSIISEITKNISL